MTGPGPLETQAQALALPAVAAVYARARETPGPGSMADGNREMMSDAIASAGVTLGAYEERILLNWMPQWEPHVVAVVAGVIRRAHLAGLGTAGTGEDGDG